MSNRFDRINALLGDRATAFNLKTKEGRVAQAAAEVAGMSLDETVDVGSAFDSFQDLLDSAKTSDYRPTLMVGPKGSSVQALRRAFVALRIADAYDAAMEALGDPRRAFRGSR